MPTRKRSTTKRTTNTQREKTRQIKKAEQHPRDLDTEDNGVPRGDWNDEPLQEDEGRSGVRSNFDDHLGHGSRRR
jgi:hypothetical protein